MTTTNTERNEVTDNAPVMGTQKTIDADDIINVIYDHVKNDEFGFQCEGCGDDSRDGSVLARKQIEELLSSVRKEAYNNGLSAQPYLVFLVHPNEIEDEKGFAEIGRMCARKGAKIVFSKPI